MDAEWVGLIGVGIGATLGALAQLLADALRSKRDRRHRNEAVRRESYVEFISAVWTAYNFTLGFGARVHERALAMVDTDDLANLDLDDLTERVQSAMYPDLTDIARQIDHALGAVLLVGPLVVGQKAQKIERLIWTQFNRLGADDVYAELLTHVNEFTALAQ